MNGDPCYFRIDLQSVCGLTERHEVHNRVSAASSALSHAFVPFGANDPPRTEASEQFCSLEQCGRRPHFASEPCRDVPPKLSPAWHPPAGWQIGGANVVSMGLDGTLCPARGAVLCTVEDRDHLHTFVSRVGDGVEAPDVDIHADHDCADNDADRLACELDAAIGNLEILTPEQRSDDLVDCVRAAFDRLCERSHTEAVERLTAARFIAEHGNYMPNEEGVYGKLGMALRAWRATEAEFLRLNGPTCPHDGKRASEHTACLNGSFGCKTKEGHMGCRGWHHPIWPEGEDWLRNHAT